MKAKYQTKIKCNNIYCIANTKEYNLHPNGCDRQMIYSLVYVSTCPFRLAYNAKVKPDKTKLKTIQNSIKEN